MQHSTQLSRPTDLLIQHLTRSLLPKSYRLRALKEAENLLELEKNLPIFVCSWTFPKLPIHLHVCLLVLLFLSHIRCSSRDTV